MAGREATEGRARLALLVLVALAALSTLVVGGTDPPIVEAATAAGDSRAAVVIDNGTQRTVSCVRFTEDHLTGLEALERTGASVTAATFGGMGRAVCSIGGVGCPLSGCLTCNAPAYWHYFRADGGRFSPSGLGASATKVRDGDVEAWGWGASPSVGVVPSIDQVCGLRPPPSPTPAPSPTPPAPTPPAATPSPGGAPIGGAAASDQGPAPGSADADADDPASSTSSPGDDGDVEDDPDATRSGVDKKGNDTGEDLDVEQAAAVGGDDGGGGNPWLAPAAVVVVLVALAAWGVHIRSSRAAPGDTSP